jgi:putative glutamine amidotransferase
VHYGGTLYQDIASDLQSQVDHGTSVAAAYHEIVFEQNFLGYSSGDSVTVAARHHQAVRDLAPGFVATARSSDGSVEAIAGRGHVGVQWHAESDQTAEKIYEEFIKHCQARTASVASVRSQLIKIPKFLSRFSR